MKRTLYILVIVIALGGAVIMGYLALTGDSGSKATVNEVGSTSTVYNILPKGKSLDFGTLQNFNRDNRLFPYPQVTNSEVGKNLGNLIK